LVARRGGRSARACGLAPVAAGGALAAAATGGPKGAPQHPTAVAGLYMVWD
jgi:hypothetical protein